MNEKKLYFTVYLTLLALTAATVGFFYLNAGRGVAIITAFTIASLKAWFIAFYFMHLREEKALIYGIITVGVTAIVILAVGTLPDLSIFVR